MELKEREQVIKDLQEIVDNYSGSWKRFNVLDNAIALIKELTEEIKSLEEDYDRVYEQAEADIHGNIANGGTSCHWCMDRTNVGTVKKMKVLIENRSSWFLTTSNGMVTSRTYQLTEDTLDQIVTELLEGKNYV